MHVVIMGCGRVGSAIALELEAAGASVSIIDQSREAFRRLGGSFQGTTVTGIGFDRDIMLEAGIEKADAFAALSNGDNSNILAARVAREVFGVKNVVARIYDPARAEIYQRLGIPTVATVTWATEQVLRRLLPGGSRGEWRDPSGKVALLEVSVDTSWFGHPISEVEERTNARVAFLTRLGDAFIPDEHTVLQEGDLLHVMAHNEEIDQVTATLNAKVN
ncbi:MAG: potassium channel family protein [Candidatus Nanopelagicaceae bacterium]|jgi:trk system potassium uptake protein TrkA